MLLQLNPVALIDPDHVATFAFPLTTIVYTVILHDMFFPAVSEFALADLNVLEYLGLALGTLDGQHLRFLFTNNTAERITAFRSPSDSTTHLYLLGEYNFDRGNVTRIAFF